MAPDGSGEPPNADLAMRAALARAEAALCAEAPDSDDFAALLSPAAAALLEPMAQRARLLTRRHFGRTIALYAPLYVSNYCPGGCAYCGFAADRVQARHRLTLAALRDELAGLRSRALQDVLLLTGERCPEADFDFLLACVREAVQVFHSVSVESFAMTGAEYARLVEAGCVGVTLYQETYDPECYARMHRWGAKRDYGFRLEAPERALAAGMRQVGMGALLGLADPRRECLALFQHATALRRRYWRSGVMLSFPRLCREVGEFAPAYPVDDRLLAQIIFAFRICLPDVPLVLSTREAPAFRDGMAGVGISRMSVASRTTVGGYGHATPADAGQFDVRDTRDVATFCAALRARNLDPVFKNWDAAFQHGMPAARDLAIAELAPGGGCV
jgi:2-iminoacetate synthase